MILIRGVPTGTGGTSTFAIPVISSFPSLEPRREQGKGSKTSPTELHLPGFHPPRRLDPGNGSVPKRPSFLFGSLPGEGKRRKVQRPPEPEHPRKVREPFLSDRVDPRSHPFAMAGSPKGYCHGSRVEPWKEWESFPEPVPRDGFGTISFFRGSVPLGGTCLPVCRGIGEPLLL
jgi:hypothetical protein